MIYSRYPFLNDAKQYVDPSTDIQYIKSSFAFLVRNLESPNPILTINFDRMDVNIFINCLIILKKISELYISKRFVANFVKRFQYFFEQDINTSKTARDEVLDFFGLSIDDYVFMNGHVHMSPPRYLQLYRGLIDQEFKLVNQNLKKGVVSVTNHMFARILRTKLELLILERIKNMKPVDHIDFGEEYNNELLRIRVKHKLPQSRKLEVDNKVLPPCITYILEKLKTTHHLIHSERILLGIFMQKRGFDLEYIIDIYKQLSDYNERITTSNLKKLSTYYVHNCSKVENEGLCKKENDERCRNLKSPLFY